MRVPFGSVGGTRGGGVSLRYAGRKAARSILAACCRLPIFCVVAMGGGGGSSSTVAGSVASCTLCGRLATDSSALQSVSSAGCWGLTTGGNMHLEAACPVACRAGVVGDWGGLLAVGEDCRRRRDWGGGDGLRRQGGGLGSLGVRGGFFFRIRSNSLFRSSTEISTCSPNWLMMTQVPGSISFGCLPPVLSGVCRPLEKLRPRSAIAPVAKSAAESGAIREALRESIPPCDILLAKSLPGSVVVSSAPVLELRRELKEALRIENFFSRGSRPRPSAISVSSLKQMVVPYFLPRVEASHTRGSPPRVMNFSRSALSPMQPVPLGWAPRAVNTFSRFASLAPNSRWNPSKLKVAPSLAFESCIMASMSMPISLVSSTCPVDTAWRSLPPRAWKASWTSVASSSSACLARNWRFSSSHTRRKVL
mmetsp:Transcript_100089/g.172770  ORF Transcript_100089/g.172770 Transcript_100089/m.172770 type:complete len:421 (-) Transcript_100089:333-1595(-)